MFNIDRTAFQRTALAAVGAVILSTTAVTAAVGPAMAGQAAPAAYAQTTLADGASA